MIYCPFIYDPFYTYITGFAGRLGPRRSDDGAPGNSKMDLKTFDLIVLLLLFLAAPNKRLKIEYWASEFLTTLWQIIRFCGQFELANCTLSLFRERD